MSSSSDACDDDDHHNDGAHDWNDHDTDGRLTGHVVYGDGDDFNVTGDVVSDDDQDVVRVALLEVPQDRKLAGRLHQRRVVALLVSGDVVSLSLHGWITFKEGFKRAEHRLNEHFHF